MYKRVKIVSLNRGNDIGKYVYLSLDPSADTAYLNVEEKNEL